MIDLAYVTNQRDLAAPPHESRERGHRVEAAAILVDDGALECDDAIAGHRTQHRDFIGLLHSPLRTLENSNNRSELLGDHTEPRGLLHTSGSRLSKSSAATPAIENP